MNKLVQITPKDMVAVALQPLQAGETPVTKRALVIGRLFEVRKSLIVLSIRVIDVG